MGPLCGHPNESQCGDESLPNMAPALPCRHSLQRQSNFPVQGKGSCFQTVSYELQIKQRLELPTVSLNIALLPFIILSKLSISSRMVHDDLFHSDEHFFCPVHISPFLQLSVSLWVTIQNSPCSALFHLFTMFPQLNLKFCLLH